MSDRSLRWPKRRDGGVRHFLALASASIAISLAATLLSLLARRWWR